MRVKSRNKIIDNIEDSPSDSNKIESPKSNYLLLISLETTGITTEELFDLFKSWIEQPHKIMKISYLPHEYAHDNNIIPPHILCYIDECKSHLFNHL